MPNMHTDTKARYCVGFTKVLLQQTVFVEQLLWAVMGDIDNHCAEGNLIAIYPPRNVFVQLINVIVAPGDIAAPDLLCAAPHPTGPTDPALGAFTCFCYPGAGGTFGVGGIGIG